MASPWLGFQRRVKMERLGVVCWLEEGVRRLSAPLERVGIFIKQVARPPGSDPKSSEGQGATLSPVEDLGLFWVKTVVVYVCLSVACVCDCKTNLLSLLIPGRGNEHKAFRKEPC